MKRILLLSCIIAVQAEALSIKDKIANLRKALAVHAQSETQTWEQLEKLDNRLALIEARISQHLKATPACKPVMPAHEKHEKKQKHHKHTQQTRDSNTQQQRQEFSSIQPYLQEKAEYLSNLLRSMREYVKNNLPNTPVVFSSCAANEREQDASQVIISKRKKLRRIHTDQAPQKPKVHKQHPRFKRHNKGTTTEAAEQPIVIKKQHPRFRRHHTSDATQAVKAQPTRPQFRARRAYISA